MSDIQIGSNVPEVTPNYVGYLYKQFAKDLQNRLAKRVYGTKVYVDANIQDDTATITFTNKPTGYEWSATVTDVMKHIASDAEEGVNEIGEIAKQIYGMYKDHIWHLFFYDYKHKTEE